jgi:hypothetical protein
MRPGAPSLHGGDPQHQFLRNSSRWAGLPQRGPAGVHLRLFGSARRCRQDGTVPVPTGPGLGVTYDWDYIRAHETARQVFGS